MDTTAVLNQNLAFFDWYLMPESYSAPLIEKMLDRVGIAEGQTVLDPFNGAGTTVLYAKLHHRNGVGIEVNPFLVFAARVKTRFDYDLPALRHDIDHLLSTAEAPLRALDGQASLFSDGNGHCDVKVTLPDMPRLYRWISPRPVAKVLTLRERIDQIQHPAHRDLCRLALAAILREVSNMKLSPHAFGSRTEKEDAPVFEAFSAKILKMYRDLKELNDKSGRWGQVDVIERDARESADVRSDLLPAHFAVTSPPYLNNLDYTMQTRMELFFLGFVKHMDDLKRVRKGMVVCDAKAMYKDMPDWKLVEGVQSVQQVAEELSAKLRGRNWGWDYPFMTRQYFGGIYRVLQGVKELLRPRAKFVLITGDSAHHGIHVPVTTITGELGERVGYRLVDIEVLRERRSSSHNFTLAESAVILEKP